MLEFALQDERDRLEASVGMPAEVHLAQAGIPEHEAWVPPRGAPREHEQLALDLRGGTVVLRRDNLGGGARFSRGGRGWGHECPLLKLVVALAQHGDAVVRVGVVVEWLADPAREPVLRPCRLRDRGVSVVGERHVECAAVGVNVAKLVTLEHNRSRAPAGRAEC
jgi:hypothetical protein